MKKVFFIFLFLIVILSSSVFAFSWHFGGSDGAFASLIKLFKDGSSYDGSSVVTFGVNDESFSSNTPKTTFSTGFSRLKLLDGNHKNMKMYHDKNVFLSLSNDWQNVMKTTTLAIWSKNKDDGSCLDFTPFILKSDLCAYPFFVITKESVNNKIFYLKDKLFLKLANIEYAEINLLTYDFNNEDLFNLNKSIDSFNSNKHSSSIYKTNIFSDDYLSFWNNFSSVVISEDSVDAGIRASVIASSINAPLFFYNEVKGFISSFVDVSTSLNAKKDFDSLPLELYFVSDAINDFSDSFPKSGVNKDFINLVLDEDNSATSSLLRKRVMLETIYDKEKNIELFRKQLIEHIMLNKINFDNIVILLSKKMIVVGSEDNLNPYNNFIFTTGSGAKIHLFDKNNLVASIVNRERVSTLNFDMTLRLRNIKESVPFFDSLSKKIIFYDSSSDIKSFLIAPYVALAKNSLLFDSSFDNYNNNKVANVCRELNILNLDLLYFKDTSFFDLTFNSLYMESDIASCFKRSNDKFFSLPISYDYNFYSTSDLSAYLMSLFFLRTPY